MEIKIEIKVKAEKFQELYQTLQAILPTMRKEKGCRDCQICQDVEDINVFCLSVRWESRTDVENYMRSASGTALLGAMDLLGESVKVRIDRDAPWEGIDTLKRMRRKTL